MGHYAQKNEDPPVNSSYALVSDINMGRGNAL